MAPVFFSCTQVENEIKISGEAQGTTYHVTYYSAGKANYSNAIDSLLKVVDHSLSTYVPSSIISRINRNDNGAAPDEHFKTVFIKAQEIARLTGGRFDITVAPLINAYGFGFVKRSQVDSTKIDSLLRFVGYEKVRMENGLVVKSDTAITFDFNALAQGYTVDLLAGYLEEKGIKSYMVELGGEVRAKGRKANGDNWKIGIDQPLENAGDGRRLQAVVKLQDKSLATSGNYRKFYVENGRKYAHIIDPKTGLPAQHNLLSATVVAMDCMTADAYATAFMVMGVERSKQFLSNHKELGLEVYFIYDENGSWNTFTSEGLKKWTEEVR